MSCSLAEADQWQRVNEFRLSLFFCAWFRIRQSRGIEREFEEETAAAAAADIMASFVSRCL